jgi:hypothetical protein
VDTAETALFASNFTDPTLGWRAYFDEASAVNFYIVNDLMGNVDGGDLYSSDYLYKDKTNSLIYMGPIWDFDISSGNVNYQPIVNPVLPWMQTSNWYEQWFKDPGFKADVVTQWNALKSNGVFTAWLASIQQQSESLEQSQANNFGRWPMLGMEVWPNPEAAGCYDGEVGYFINWLNLRVAYLDSLFDNKAQTYTTLGVAGGTLRSGVPVTLTSQVTGGTTPTGVVSFLSSGVLLGTGTLLPGGGTSFTGSNLPAGLDNLQAVYNGDTGNALSASAIQSVTVATPLGDTVTSIAGPLSIADQGNSTNFSASVIGNSGTAAPAGAVAFSVDGGVGANITLDSNGNASYYTSSLTVGTHTIAVSYSGDASHTASSGTLTITLVPTVATPTFSPASGTYASVQTVTISDATADASIFYTTDGTIPTINSTNYTRAITINSTETINTIAAASGYITSDVPTATYTINLPAADFFIAVSPASLSITHGLVGTSTVSVIPQNGFAAAVSFSCSGLPSGAVCNFSPAKVTPAGATATTTLTVLGVSGESRNSRPLFPGATLVVALSCLGWKKRRLQTLLMLAVCAFGLSLLYGCGASAHRPTTSTVTVTATAGSLQHTSTFSLTAK